jgi:hypothetical protein
MKTLPVLATGGCIIVLAIGFIATQFNRALSEPDPQLVPYKDTARVLTLGSVANGNLYKIYDNNCIVYVFSSRLTGYTYGTTASMQVICDGKAE